MGAQTMTASANVQTMQRLYDAFGRGDIPGVLGALDPNVEWVEMDGAPYPGTFTGPEAVLNGVFMRLGTEWEGFRAEPHEYLDAGEHVVALGRYSGTYRASGTAMSAAFAHVWTLRDGRIVRFRQYADTRRLMEALE